jgi:hypothetical protein
LGLAATPAKAAEFGVYIGGPAAYVPPCPGPGYEWVAGYYSGSYWVPGRWAFAGYHNNVARYYGDRDRVYYNDRDDRRGGDWDRDRHNRDDRRGGDWDRDRHDRDDRRGDQDRDHWRR